MMQFKKAERKRVNARVAIEGPTGSGKTMTALILAQDLATHFGGKVAVIDTERQSASIYADRFNFDVLELETFSVQNYLGAINAAADAGYGVLVIDSLSHAWAGKGGVLEAVDKAAKRMKTPNTYVAWREGTTLQDDLIEAMLRYPGHLIVTMRSKMDYVQDKNADGKTIVKKIGMAPVQREGVEYEFTIVGEMDVDHNLIITKSRCEALADQVYPKPGANFTDPLMRWLDGGAVAAENNEADHAAEDERKKLVVKVQATLAVAKKEGRGGLDIVNHYDNWIKKWCNGDVNSCDTATLEAAMADLTEKFTADYRKMAHELTEALVEQYGESMLLALSDLRDEILRTPKDLTPTNDIDAASPHTLKKYIMGMDKIMKEKAA